MTFRAGQKVVCVDDSPDLAGRPIVVIKGAVYTVTHVFECLGLPGVLLAEVSPGKAPGWIATRFRPVAERRTDIGFAVLEEIRKRESPPAPAPRKKVAHTSTV